MIPAAFTPRRGALALSLPLIMFAGPCSSSPDAPDVFEPVSNANYTANAELSQQEIIDAASGPFGGFSSDEFTFVVDEPDNGPQPGQGQFRVACDYSHFAYDDPIVKPNEFGAAHLHMFWGNTTTDAASRVTPNADPNDPTELLENGGGTCQGGVLNRSAYWMPAMYSGPAGPDRQIVLPTDITIYYKSYQPDSVQPLPQGVEFLAGNIFPGGSHGVSFDATADTNWGCYQPDLGLVVERLSTIPTDCDPDHTIQAVVQFPQCLAVDQNGGPQLRSTDHVAHTALIDNNDDCPSSHPYRVPQISYLVEWPNLGAAEVAQWRLSCDTGFNQDAPPEPGGCLHADWIGGWNDLTMDAWITGCHSGPAGPRNCSSGQTGQNGTSRRLNDIDRSRTEFLVPDPCNSCFNDRMPLLEPDTAATGADG